MIKRRLGEILENESKEFADILGCKGKKKQEIKIWQGFSNLIIGNEDRQPLKSYLDQGAITLMLSWNLWVNFWRLVFSIFTFALKQLILWFKIYFILNFIQI